MDCSNKCGCSTLPEPPDKEYKSLQEMVDWYAKHRKDKLFVDMELFDTLLDCITGAPGENKERLPDSTEPGVPRYKKGSHQRRLTNKVINDAWKKFQKLDIHLRNFSDFDSFVDYITANTVKGFGPTCIYDFCLSFGYKYGLRPEKKVYIHAGPAQSVKALRKLKLIDAKVVHNRLNLESLPIEIQSLGAAYAEDFLCVFHNAISKLK